MINNDQISQTFDIFMKLTRTFDTLRSIKVLEPSLYWSNNSKANFRDKQINYDKKYDKKTEGTNLRVLGRSIEPFRAYGSYHVI